MKNWEVLIDEGSTLQFSSNYWVESHVGRVHPPWVLCTRCCSGQLGYCPPPPALKGGCALIGKKGRVVRS